MTFIIHLHYLSQYLHGINFEFMCAKLLAKHTHHKNISNVLITEAGFIKDTPSNNSTNTYQIPVVG